MFSLPLIVRRLWTPATVSTCEGDMAFARFERNSDVYVYADARGGYTCERCPKIGEEFRCLNAQQMIAHLHEHRAAGKRVPDQAFTALESEPAVAEIERRKAWFEQYARQLDEHPVMKGAESGPHRCPCCQSKTLSERGVFDICPVCFWEDDGQDDHDADSIRGGPNGSLSLTEARENYRRIGASNEKRLKRIRPPHEEEK